MKVSKIIAKLHKWPHTFLPIYHLQFLNLLKLSLFLGCTLISVMASSISSVEDRNTPEYLNFFGQPISKRIVDLLLLGKKMVLLHAHKLGVQCTDCQCGAPWKQWSYCSGMVPPLSEVCACLGRTQQGTGCHCQNILCKLLPATFFLRCNLRAHRDWAKELFCQEK